MALGGALVDVNGYKVLRNFAVSSASSWSNTNPNIYYGFIYQTGRFMSVDISPFKTGDNNFNESLVITSDFSNCSLGAGEGSLTRDESRAVFDFYKGGRKLLVSVDLKSKSILGTLVPDVKYNWTSFSHSGNYIVVENARYPLTQNPVSTWNLMRYDPNFSNPVGLHGSVYHGDLGVDENGEDNYVMVGWPELSAIRLRDGKKTVLIGSQNNPIHHGHVSCRNLRRPGWCYFSENYGTLGP